MPTFKEVAEYWLEENSADKVDLDLVYQNIGNIDIKSVTSDELQKLFNNLYDNVKLRGVVFTSYDKVIGDIFQFAFNRGYISQVPKIERRNAPPPNLFHQPDSSTMQLLLSHEDCTPAGTILRLAWYCGLLRNEITYLLWEQVDFKQKQISLVNRSVPLNDEMLSYLMRLRNQNLHLSEYVLISQRQTAPMAEQSVSALARRTLDRYKLNDVRLNDLRIDFIVRALKENNWEYVSHISGVDLPALQQHYLPYIGSDDVIRSEEKTEITQIVREQLKDFIEKEKTSMVALSIRFVWQMGIPVSVLPLLTWEVIDFDNSVAVFSDRTVSIPDDFLAILRETKKSRGAEYQNIILNTLDKPTDYVFIQKAVQQALIRSGIMGITLPDLQYDYWWHNYPELKKMLNADYSFEISSEIYSVPKNLSTKLKIPSEGELLAYLQDNGSADSKALKDALKLTEKELSLLLQDCQDKGKVVRVGFKYFLPNTIVPREKQRELILEYVKKNQPVTSADLTKLLGLADRRQIYWVIKPLLKSGELVRINRNQYCTPEYKGSLEIA